MSATCCELQAAADTMALGAALARSLTLPHPPQRAWCLYLCGELGAGKTTLCRGFLAACGHCGPVRSPTYTLVECYTMGKLQVSHFDLYRLAAPQELEDCGVRDYFAPGCVCLIEWPERAAGLLPAPDVRIDLSYNGSARMCRLETAILSDAQLYALTAGLALP